MMMVKGQIEAARDQAQNTVKVVGEGVDLDDIPSDEMGQA